MGSGPMVGASDGWLGASPGGAGGGGGSGKTLASIYAFGLTDNPTADNMFGMPSGPLRFPGNTFWGAGFRAAAIEFYESRSINFAEPPWFGLISYARNLSGIGGAGTGGYWEYEMNDPSWNGDPATLFNTLWQVESINFSADQTQGPAHQATPFASRGYDMNGTVPYTWPASATDGVSSRHKMSLWQNISSAVADINVYNGYGFEQSILYRVRAGATLRELVHWNETGFSPAAAGDGPAWFVDIDGRIDHQIYRAGHQFYKATTDPNGAWGWRLIGYDGTSPTLTITADISTVSAAFIAPMFSGGPTTDPLGGLNAGGFFSNTNATRYLSIANESGGVDAESGVLFLCGSWNASAGATPQITLNSPAATGTTLTAGPQNFYILHNPKVSAPFDIANAQGNIRFGGSPSGGVLAEVMEIDNTSSLVKFGSPSFKANGTQTVTIGSTGPASLTSLTPSKWLTIEDNTGAKFAFPIYATT